MPARVAFPLSSPIRLTLAAMDADRAGRPDDALQLGIGGGFIAEDRLVKDAAHGRFPYLAEPYPISLGLASIKSPDNGR